MAGEFLIWARKCIEADERGYLIWMSQRAFPGGWNRHALTCAAYGFRVAQAKLPPAKNKIAPEADDAYLLAHHLCRDLRSDGPMHPIGKETGNPDELSKEQVRALLYVWFIEKREEQTAPVTKREQASEELLAELSAMGPEDVHDSEPAPPPEG